MGLRVWYGVEGLLRVTEETLGIGSALEPLAWEISQLEGKCLSSGFGVEGLGLGVQSSP